MVPVSEDTVLHPVGAAAFVVLAAATVVVPRRWAVVPSLVIVCFVSPAQQLVLAGLHFQLVRLMVLAGWARVLLRGEWKGFHWRGLDTLFLVYLFAASAAYVAKRGEVGAVVNRAGTAYEAAGLYFLFRFLVRDLEDVRALARGMCWVTLPVFAFFVVEAATSHNVFAVFGGVPEVTEAREGRLRCQGPFPHPIIAGCFFAAAFPMLVSTCWQKRGGVALGVASAVACVGVIVLCASSTPVAALGAAMLGMATFPLRRRLRPLLLAALLVPLALHFIMRAPVWHLLARVDLSGGSTGWHRYHLIEATVEHFDEWVVAGTLSTEKWGNGMTDLTNQYVAEGVRGGLVALVLFVALILGGMRSLGSALARSRKDTSSSLMLWAVGTSVFVHAVNFLGVSYFGQIGLFWYLSLALCGSLGGTRPAASAGGAGSARTQNRDRVLSSDGGRPRGAPVGARRS